MVVNISPSTCVSLIHDVSPYCVIGDGMRQGLLSDDVACEEQIKSALCELLQHLCDCQVSRYRPINSAHYISHEIHVGQQKSIVFRL